jgi:aspartyl-tRNA(Asn)/glutamyl-tRNA(Gln) amidotransferase subunit A
LLSQAGAQVFEVNPAWPVEPLEPFAIFWAAACAATVGCFEKERWPLLDPVLTSMERKARTMSLIDHQRAIQQRQALTVAAWEFFQRFDILVAPVMPIPPFAVERNVPAGFDENDWRWCPYTYLWNMTGQPAASVPIGFTATGLPVGVQIIARIGREADVLRVAAAIERRKPLHKVRPPHLLN